MSRFGSDRLQGFDNPDGQPAAARGFRDEDPFQFGESIVERDASAADRLSVPVGDQKGKAEASGW